MWKIPPMTRYARQVRITSLLWVLIVSRTGSSGPARRFPERLLKGDFADGVKTAAREISARLGYTRDKAGYKP